VANTINGSRGKVTKRVAKPSPCQSVGREIQPIPTVSGNDPRCQVTIADQIERFQGALTARQLSELLSVSAVTVFKMAKSGRLPCLRIGASVRFCPASIARWLRERGG
jgi:excisionase family DNA binding protein